MAGRTPSRPIIVFCRLNTSDLGLWLLRQAMTEAKDIELLYDLWEQNVDILRTLQRYSKEESGIVTKLVAHLRLCAVGLVKQAGASQASQKESVARSDDPVARRIIDKSTAISEAKRIRCKEHLRYVAANLASSADGHPLTPTM